MQDYRKLLVWQKSHTLALTTYELPAYLTKPEAWPLRDQILRATGYWLPPTAYRSLLLTNAIILLSGDHDGTLIVPWPP